MCDIHLSNFTHGTAIMDDVSIWIQQLGAGNDEAAERLWDRYFERLVRLARGRLDSVPMAAFDGEDVALSAFKSFFQRFSAGEFPDVRNRLQLWHLLATITTRKASDYRKHHFTAKRGGGRVRHASNLQAGFEDANDLLEQVLTTDQTPEAAAIMSEACGKLLSELQADESLMEVALKKLEGYTNLEIAQQLEVSERTIERKLARIRSQWESAAIELA